MARLLVVEDEPTDRVILAELLERMGHEVYLASDGEEAFKSYLKNSIEIIITDLNMPHVDGLVFIVELKSLFPDVPVIAVSGKGPELLDAATSRGAFAALSKPIDPQELRKAIAEAAQDSLGRRKKGRCRNQGPERRAVDPHCRGRSRPSCANPGSVQNEPRPKQDSFRLLRLGGSGIPQ